MKKIILVVSLMSIVIGVSAQIDSTRIEPNQQKNNSKQDLIGTPKGDGYSPNPDSDPNHDKNLNNSNDLPKDQEGNKIQPVKEPIMKDGIIKKNGGIMIVKDGNMLPLEKDITLRNGTKVTIDGTIINKDGTKFRLMEGEYIDMSGNVIPKQN